MSPTLMSSLSVLSAIIIQVIKRFYRNQKDVGMAVVKKSAEAQGHHYGNPVFSNIPIYTSDLLHMHEQLSIIYYIVHS